MKKLLLIITVIFLLPLSSCKFIKEKGWFGSNKADTMVVWQARQDSIRVADSIRTVQVRAEQAAQAKRDSIQAIEDARLAMEARFRYHIVVGSFLTPEFADTYSEYYRKMGYDTKIIDDSAGRFKLVSAEAHESLKEAARRLHAFQDTVEFEAWIYIKN